MEWICSTTSVLLIFTHFENAINPNLDKTLKIFKYMDQLCLVESLLSILE